MPDAATDEGFFDSEDTCPSCKTSKATDPKLVLLYANCCDARLCVNCISSRFARVRQTKCLRCGDTLDKNRYKKEPLAETKFREEASKRKWVNSIFNSFLCDFATIKGYNDYLEMVEDLVYTLVHGTATEKRLAEQQLKAHKKENRDDIERNASKRIENEQGRQITEEEQEVKKFAPQIEHLDLPEPPKYLGFVMNDFNKQLTQNRRAPPPDWKKLLELQRYAGGFTTKQMKRRNQREAFAGLFHFDENPI